MQMLLEKIHGTCFVLLPLDGRVSFYQDNELRVHDLHRMLYGGHIQESEEATR